MISEEKQKLLVLYNRALQLYKERKWQAAQDGFEQALNIDSEDGPSRLYLDRCKQYLANPPGDDWDGVFVMTTK